MPRRAAILAIVVAAGILLTSCTSTPLPEQTPAPGAGIAGLPVVPDDDVPGVTRTPIARAGDAPIAVDVPAATGAEALNSTVDRVVLTAIDDYLGASAPDGYLAALAPEGLSAATAPSEEGLHVHGDLALAAGDWLGIRTSISLAGTALAQDVSYGDVSTGAVVAAAALIESDRVDDAVALLGADASAEQLRSLSFAPDGSAVVAAVSPQGDPIVIAAPEITPLLTETGRAVQDAARSGAPPRARPAAAPHVPCSLVACVALTFDDGPSPDTTPGLLDVLAEKAVPATFFVEGRWAQAYPQIIQRETSSGHAVENHTWDHPDLATLSTDDIRAQISSTDDAVVAAGAQSPTLIRPPYGSTGGAVTSSVDKPLVYWSVDSFDWRDQDPAVFVPRVLERIAPGGIVLMHDIYPSTVAGVPTLIDGLRDRGYTFVTVPQLTSGQTLQAGEVYTCRGIGRSDAGPTCSGR